MSEQNQDQAEDVIATDDGADQNDDGVEHHDDADQGADGADPQASEGQPDDDAVVVTIGDEPQPEEDQHSQAPAWVKELRKSQRELQRENRELKAKMEQGSAPKQPEITLGKKPTLEDHDYDAERFEQSLEAWYERKRQVDAQAEKARKDQEAQQAAWQEKLTGYQAAKAALKVPDYEDAEHVATETFSVTQQGVMLQGADNPALVIYALGKNPKKAKELAAITDPVKFAFAVAKLESQLKVTSRKAPPPPEKSIRGTAPVSGAVDSTLDRLRAEAEKTGDMTKVIRYKAEQRRKQS